MLKKISIAVFAAAISTSAFAAQTETGQNTSDNASVEAQIAQLKKDIDDLRQEQRQAQTGALKDKASADSTNAQVTVPTVPTNAGQIQNFLFSDIRDGVVPMGLISSSQFALGLLKQRNHYSDAALIFGGYLEADAQVWNGSNFQRAKQSGEQAGNYYYQSGRGVYITTANLYTAANLGRYVTTEMALSGSQVGDPSVQSALVMFGNLDDYPLYATIGKNRIPFGSFAGGGPWTGSLSQILFRPDYETTASVAYYKDGLSTNVSLFQTSDQSSDFSYAAFYGDQIGKWSYGVNGGYLYNVNGSGNDSFNSITQSNGSAIKRVGAVNFEGSLNYDIYGIGAGWSQTTDKDAKTNNGYAGSWYLQVGVSPMIYGRSTNFSVSYNGAYNTNDIPVVLSGSAPNGYTTDGSTDSGVNQMVIGTVQRPFFTENVLVGLEYVYMHMYSGNHTNTYTMDLSVYF